AAHGDGWNPFPASPLLAQTARTIPLEGLSDLAPMLDHLWAEVEKAGRDRSEIDVTFAPGMAGPGSAGFDRDAYLERLDEMAKLGVTWTSGGVPADSVEHAIEVIEQYG